METNTLQGEAMKFVINGRTFDAASATKTAIHRGISQPAGNAFIEDHELRWEDTLYRTAKGAFFLHEHNTKKLAKGGRPIVTDEASELDPAQAVKWVMDRGAIVLDATGLDLPEEA